MGSANNNKKKYLLSFGIHFFVPRMDDIVCSLRFSITGTQFSVVITIIKDYIFSLDTTSNIKHSLTHTHIHDSDT